ncbi:hypothetical protein [Vibrio owensii]|uniref:hypothetical protein n=1 Tax=Vibrio owensii TaxID=696485 RepID=UPI0018F182E4|nr:hypothetical protein [Vibrio owensii]
MDKTLIVKTRNKGFLRADLSFGELVGGEPVILDSRAKAKDFISFLTTPMFIGGKVSTPEESLVYFDESVCCTYDRDTLANFFDIYLVSKCSFKVEPFIDMSSLEETSKFELNYASGMSVEDVELRVIDRNRYFLHKGRTVYASFGMVLADAESKL